MMTAKMFYKRSWWRSALAVLLIMCMVTTMLVATTVEAEAVAVLPGLVCGAGVALTIGALLAGSGVPMSEENSAALINAFYWGCDETQLAIIENFSAGQAIGDLFEAVSGWFGGVLNSVGRIFYNPSSSFVLPTVTLRDGSSYKHTYYDFNNWSDYSISVYEAEPDVVFSKYGLNWVWHDVSSVGSTTYGCLYQVGSDGTETSLVFSTGEYRTSVVYPFNSVYLYCESSPRLKSYCVQMNGDSSIASYGTVDVSTGSSTLSIEWVDYLISIMSSGDYNGSSYAEVLTEYLPTSTDTEKALVTTTPVYVPQTWEQLWDATPEIVRTGTFTDVDTGSGEVVDPGGTTDPDNPDDDTDIVVGDATGTITGDGTGTGIFEGLGNFVLKLPLLSQIVTFIQNIIHLITSGNSLITSIQSVLQSIWQSITGIPQALSDIWTSVKELLSPVTGILTGVQSLVTSVGALASGEVPAELQDRIYQFSGQIFDLLSWDELSQSMAALEDFGSGYGEPPVISINLHNLLEPAQNIGRFDNEFNNTETTVIDFKILEDDRFCFMGMTLIELIRMMVAISMIWYTAWYVWGKIVPDDAIK